MHDQQPTKLDLIIFRWRAVENICLFDHMEIFNDGCMAFIQFIMLPDIEVSKNETLLSFVWIL